MNNKITEQDKQLLNEMTSQRIQSRLSALVKNITKRYDIRLDVILNVGSQCTVKGKDKIHVFIDPLQAFEPGISKEELYLRMTGLAAHEAGHILFSDFNEVGKLSLKEKHYKKAIQQLAEKVNKSEISKPISLENKELLETIKNYIFCVNLKEMQNSLEDAAVENEVPVNNPRVYGGIVSMRDYVVKVEEEYLKKNIASYKKQDKNILEYFMTEIRHMATIGYRREKTSVIFLKKLFNQKEIQEIYWMSLYARICTKNTAERTAIGELLLEKFDDFFSKKALEIYRNYMSTLNMSAADLMNMMQNSCSGHTECSIQNPLDASLSGKTAPQNMSSDYSLDMPDNIEKKINDKLKEQEGKETENAAQSNDTCTSSSSSDSNKKKLDKKTAQADAEAAKKDALKKYKDSFLKEEAKDFHKAVGEGNSKTPTLKDNQGNINSLSDMHKGIKTAYYPSKCIQGMSASGFVVKLREQELKKISNNFSKKLKEILMYRAKCKKKTAMKRGSLNDEDLYRIVTDAKVFKEKIPGIINKARLCVLIDLSGSMSGQKIEDAIAGAYILADACQRIQVPISILGHNFSGDICDLYHFIEYENCHKKESKEKLLSAQSSGCNHDSIAIFHSLTDLVRHRKSNEQLVFLIISDGAPAGGNNYYGKAADEDIKMIYNGFEKNYHTKTIGIGIGNDVAHIPQIYKDYLLVPNVSKLGSELLKVLKDLLM